MIWIAVLFIILGIVIKYEKMYGLIAGYKSMSSQEKAKYNIKKLATLLRNVLFVMALIIICGFVAAKMLNNPNTVVIVISVAIALGVSYLLYQSNSKKYKNTEIKK